MKDRKTTITGALLILIGGALTFGLITGDDVLTAQEIIANVVAYLTGFGLLGARDNKRTNEAGPP